MAGIRGVSGLLDVGLLTVKHVIVGNLGLTLSAYFVVFVYRKEAIRLTTETAVRHYFAFLALCHAPASAFFCPYRPDGGDGDSRGGGGLQYHR